MTADSHSAGEEAGSLWTFSRVLPAVWRRRLTLLWVALAAAAITLLINLLLPPLYRATASLLPDIDGGRLSMQMKAAEVAQIMGVGSGTPDPAKLYPAILTSDTILREAVLARYPASASTDSSSLLDRFRATAGTREENIHAAVERLRDLLEVQHENRTGVVTVSLALQSPDLAANVLGRIIGGLEAFMRHRRSTQATEQRLWVERRLADVGAELHDAEEVLRSFREKNRQVFDSPRLLLEEERLAREVQVKSTVFIELARQLELAKIEEIRTMTIVNVLDAPRPPVERERPRRTANTLLAFFGTLLAGAFAIGWREVYGDRLRHAPAGSSPDRELPDP